ncbi:hypothetical protein CYMTET_31166 [Cymbomonas tetramitiformis]|uniref:Uncharacterized protein n=1 Tax=Cymbomonas tetramitiformis TaxID=36881 RepID=A0AAE0FHN1_9CHLO|nr:hypothetical protein CYMTET_31166 [Cymbomonas tetramitiformis]
MGAGASRVKDGDETAGVYPDVLIERRYKIKLAATNKRGDATDIPLLTKARMTGPPTCLLIALPKSAQEKLNTPCFRTIRLGSRYADTPISLPSNSATSYCNFWARVSSELSKALIYYSKDHVKENLCTSSPGPVYTVTPPAGLSHAYSYDRSVGRTQETKVTFYPPSRLHETSSGFGKQLFSHRQSQPTYSFGTGTRVSQEKVFLSAKHQKHIFGHVTPGPSTSGPVSSLGSQNLSLKKSSPASRFGTSTRFMQLKCQDTSQTPGPGAYH